MKNYKQILEAVNRGIQLALDDFDDEEQVQNIKSKQVQNRDYTKEYLDLMNEAVDLGLPSGTLWCKYNLGVDQNQLSKAEDWYGDYYAWGELEDKSKQYIKYNWITYKFAKNGQSNNLTKYVTDSTFGAYDKRIGYILDNLTQLRPEDDAAYQNKKLHNFKFHIPTKEQFEELIKYIDNYWVNNYNPNYLKHNPEDDGGIKGLNGRVFEGKNGNTLFIPAAGSRDGSNVYNTGTSCNLQTSSLYLKNPSHSYQAYSSSNSVGLYDDFRYTGNSIRPVINL